MQNKTLFDQINGIATILFAISCLFFLLLFMFIHFLYRWTEEPSGKSGVDYEKKNTRYPVNFNLIKKPVNLISALLNRIGIIGYLKEYEMQARKIIEIYLKEIRGQKKSANLNLLEKSVKPPSVLRNRIIGILGYLIVMLLCIAVLVGYAMLHKFIHSDNTEYKNLVAIILIVILLIIIKLRINQWS